MFDVWESVLELRQPCLTRAISEAATGKDGIVKEAVLRSIDDTVWEELERRLLESPLPALQGANLYTDDKWLTTSSLQKCVRRGHRDLAERHARSGVRIDADHCFRRLAIIALEDIGLGDLKLVASTLAVLGDKRRRVRLGEERLAAFLAREMSSAVKSRLACEMLSLVEYDGGVISLAPAVTHLSPHQLGEIIVQEQFASTRQIIALLALHGTDRLRSRTIPERRGVGARGLLIVLARLGAPLIFHYIVRRGLSRCRDSLAIPYVLLATLIDDNFNVSGRTLRHPIMIGSYPAFAYDMHTRIGKLAIRRFKIDARKELAGSGVVSAENLIFVLEGGLLDRQLCNPQLSELASKAAQLEIFGENNESAKSRLSTLRQSNLLGLLRRPAAVRMI